MHEGVTDTKMKLDVLIQIALEHILAQRFKQSIQWAAHGAHINKYVPVNAINHGNSSGRMF